MRHAPIIPNTVPNGQRNSDEFEPNTKPNPAPRRAVSQLPIWQVHQLPRPKPSKPSNISVTNHTQSLTHQNRCFPFSQARRTLSSATSQRFLLLFLEKEDYPDAIGFLDATRTASFLGARPQTPWVRFAEVWACNLCLTSAKETVSRSFITRKKEPETAVGFCLCNHVPQRVERIGVPMSIKFN
jgi:hypothetical protein